MTVGRTLTPLEKEWKKLRRKERAMERAAVKAAPPKWKEELERRVPEKVLTGLQSAFSKGFSVVFQHGTKLLEKTYRAEELKRQHRDSDGIIMDGELRKGFRRLKTNSQTAQLCGLTVTAAEGIGLGALGVGMPDIVLFLGMLLRGIYETALRFGFPYDTPQERLLILKMMEAAVSRGEDRVRCSAEVECLLESDRIPTEEDLNEQIRRTGNAFAVEMLLVKFVQGFPVVGILGGAANPIYYNKVLQYVQRKYQKRYLRAVAGRWNCGTSRWIFADLAGNRGIS